MEIYIRKTFRPYGDKFIQCLDLANIQVHPKYQGQGVFTSYLEEVEREKPLDAVYIENVIDPVFQRFFDKRGYEKITDNFTLVSSYRKIWD